MGAIEIMWEGMREVGDLLVGKRGVMVEIVVWRRRGDTKLCGGEEVTGNCCVEEKR